MAGNEKGAHFDKKCSTEFINCNYVDDGFLGCSVLWRVFNCELNEFTCLSKGYGTSREIRFQGICN